jgi:hypothetical protein
VPIPPGAHPEVAEKAEQLGKETLTMKSYQQFEAGAWTWFFSPNNKLDGAKGRPGKLTSWADFRNLLRTGSAQARVISDLAGLNSNRLTEKDWKALKAAYDLWPPTRYATFWSTDSNRAYLCNVFVGDVLFLANKPRIREGGKYWSAEHLYKGKVPRTYQVDAKDVSRGDIASWEFNPTTHHMEIITSVDRPSWFGDDNFCSRGAGRGEDQGEERCDSSWGDETRELHLSNLKVFRLS